MENHNGAPDGALGMAMLETHDGGSVQVDMNTARPPPGTVLRAVRFDLLDVVCAAVVLIGQPATAQMVFEFVQSLQYRFALQMDPEPTLTSVSDLLFTLVAGATGTTIWITSNPAHPHDARFHVSAENLDAFLNSVMNPRGPLTALPPPEQAALLRVFILARVILFPAMVRN